MQIPLVTSSQLRRIEALLTDVDSLMLSAAEYTDFDVRRDLDALLTKITTARLRAEIREQSPHSPASNYSQAAANLFTRGSYSKTTSR